jgi:hypothetical protein
MSLKEIHYKFDVGKRNFSKSTVWEPSALNVIEWKPSEFNVLEWKPSEFYVALSGNPVNFMLH